MGDDDDDSNDDETASSLYQRSVWVQSSNERHSELLITTVYTEM